MIVNGNTKVYGIIGNPVSHSLSPVMHNAAFKALQENRVYIPLPVGDIAAGVIGLKGLGIHGASVTIPHKETVIPYLDHVNPVALKIGAVNTIHMVETTNGRELSGSNTDWLGANRALLTKTTLTGKDVVVLGAGGSAKAIGFGLLEAGANIVICSRTESRGRLLATELGCAWYGLNTLSELKGNILVNATSAGMAPNSDVSIVEERDLNGYQVVMDIVYSPLKTRLLREAETAGCTTVNGLEMLLYQGVAQFELWTGKDAPVEVMRKALLEATGNI